MTTTDDTFVTRLMAAADREAPPMALDAVRTLELGRRRRRHRAASWTGLVGVTVAVLAFGTSNLDVTPPPMPADEPTSPAPTPEPEPRPVESAVQGIESATGATLRTLPDGSTWWDTGLRWTSTGTGTVAFRAPDDADVDGAGTPRPQWRGVVIAELSTDTVELRRTLTWDPDATLEENGPEIGYSSLDGTVIDEPVDEPDPVDVVHSVVPAWMPGARVALVLHHGAPDALGDVQHVVEIPTFDDPTGSGAELFMFTIDPRLVVDARHGPDGAPVQMPPLVVFVSDDGTTYVNGVPLTTHLQYASTEVTRDEVAAALRAMGAEL